MNTDKFIALCVQEIIKYFNERVDKTDKKELKRGRCICSMELQNSSK